MNPSRQHRASVLAAVPLLFPLLASGAFAKGDYEPFDAAKFKNPTVVDNPWFPLEPGTRWQWEGTSVDDEGVEEDHTVIFTVTDLTKVIDGVRTVVCWDQDIVDGELEESELVFFAQADDGSVWHFGQYPEEYDGREILATPAWVHGIGDGRAGIIMKAKPKLGSPSYSQGWAPSVPWTDRAVVYQMGQKTTVPAGSFEDVLVMDESSREEPDAHQLKYYAKGVGVVRVGYRGEPTDRETLELVSVEKLDAAALAEARKTALAMEKRAFGKSPQVYALSQPLQDRAGETLHSPQMHASSEEPEPEPVRKISDEKASEIARKAVPGEVMDVAVERKLGAKRLVVEVISDEDGGEVDVIIDMESGEVLGTEK